MVFWSIQPKEKPTRKQKTGSRSSWHSAKFRKPLLKLWQNWLPAKNKHVKLWKSTKTDRWEKLASQKAAPRFLRLGKMALINLPLSGSWATKSGRWITTHLQQREHKGRSHVSATLREAEKSCYETNQLEILLDFVKEIKAEIQDPTKANYQDRPVFSSTKI